MLHLNLQHKCSLDVIGSQTQDATMTNTDPAAFFRDMLGEWEKMANKVGGDFARSDDFTRAMHGATAATMSTQEAISAMMTRALAAANMPSRTEIEDLSGRLGRIEDQLARIEAALGGKAERPARPKPSRTRKPPEKKS